VVPTNPPDAAAYARETLHRLSAAGLPAEGDVRTEKINHKVREHSLAKIPVILAIGKREVAESTVSVRRLGQQGQAILPVAQAVEQLRAEANARGRIAPEAAA
jgi:threonyl-tRNA synthetase